MEDNPVGESGNEHLERKRWKGVLDTVEEEKDEAASMAEDDPEDVYTTKDDSEDDNLSDITEYRPNRVKWPDMDQLKGPDPVELLENTVRRAQKYPQNDMDFFDAAEKAMERRKPQFDRRASFQLPAQDGFEQARKKASQVFSRDQMQHDERAISIRSPGASSPMAEPSFGGINMEMSGVSKNPQSTSTLPISGPASGRASFSFDANSYGSSSPPPPRPHMGYPALRPLKPVGPPPPGLPMGPPTFPPRMPSPPPPVVLEWMVRSEAGNWALPTNLYTSAREAMQAHVDQLHADSRFQTRCRNGNLDPFCFGCQVIEKNASICEHEEDIFTACSICVHTGKQPCARLMEHPSSKGSYFIGFLPLPPKLREGTAWHRMDYWVRPGAPKGVPKKKNLDPPQVGERQSPRKSNVAE